LVPIGVGFLTLVPAFESLLLSELPRIASPFVRLLHRLPVSAVAASAVTSPILRVKYTVTALSSVLPHVGLLENAAHTVVAASTVSAPIRLSRQSLLHFLPLSALLLRTLTVHHLFLPAPSVLLLTALLTHLLLLFASLLLPRLLGLTLLATLLLHLQPALALLLPTLSLLLTFLLNLALLLPTLRLLLCRSLLLSTLLHLNLTLLVPLLLTLLHLNLALLHLWLAHLNLALLLHLRRPLLALRHLNLARLLPTRITSSPVAAARILRPLLLWRLTATTAAAPASAVPASLCKSTGRSEHQTHCDRQKS
jgi:hypothetical protein